MEKFGQYILISKIGSGGMAELFKAKKLGIEGFERVLAIKRILPHLSSDEEFIDMFIAEAKLVARLTNKNIVQVYDFGRIGQNYFISMEYIRGKDLRAIMKRSREKGIKFPIPLAVFIAKEVASALGYAHTQKDNTGKDLSIIHRDVSPQNVLISYQGETKVVDFGIAKAGAHSKTTTGVLKGKLSYMSPEQAWGKPIDHRSDIFSLGIVAYEMFTGERLFKGDSEINTLEKVREAKVEPMPSVINTDLPQNLEAKLLKALARDVNERYQSAAELESEFGEVLFSLLHTDPNVSLKQFMHELFKEEIDAEHRSEMEEETVSFEVEEEPALAEQKSHRTGAIKAKKLPLREKRKIYPYIISTILLIVLIAGGFVFWTNYDKTIPSDNAQTASEKSETAKPNDQGAPLTVTEKKPESSAVNNEQKTAVQSDTGSSEKTKDGSVIVNAVPWAKVFIDGKPYGTTPKTIENLKAGSYNLKLDNPSFPPWETKITVSANQATKISYKFGGFGKLIVNASPWGNVYIDGALKGQTPLTIERIPSGKHMVKIEKEGYIGVSKNITINEGSSEKISFSLNKEGEQ
jgi:serine/threonine protein kinase